MKRQYISTELHGVVSQNTEHRYGPKCAPVHICVLCGVWTAGAEEVTADRRGASRCVLLIKHHEGDQINYDGLDGTCSTYVGRELHAGFRRENLKETIWKI